MNKRIQKAGILGALILGLVGCSGIKEDRAVSVEQDTKQNVEENAEDLLATMPVEIDSDLEIESGTHIAVVMKDMTYGYWKNMKDYMEEAVDCFNSVYGFKGSDKITITCEGVKSESDVTGQINMLDAVLSENPGVLCLAALDANSCGAQLETAEENGIPVVMMDSNVNNSLAKIYCGTDNKQAGATAAEKLCESISDRGKVMVVAHERISKTSKDRVKGFRKEIRTNHDNVSISTILYENQDIETQIRDFLDENPDVQGIFCTNENVAEITIGVLEDYQDRKISLVGFDAGKTQKKAIEEGIEYGLIAQDTYKMAYETVWTALQAASDVQDLEGCKYVPYQWIDSENLSAEDSEKILYD